MLIPAFSTLSAQDYPSEQSWIAKLLSPINLLFTNVVQALNGNITLGDNIPCQTISLNFVYGGASDFPKKSKWSITQNQDKPTVTPPIEMRVCSALENNVAIALVPAWSYSEGVITFSYFVKLTSAGVVGLTSGATYKIVLRGQP